MKFSASFLKFEERMEQNQLISIHWKSEGEPTVTPTFLKAKLPLEEACIFKCCCRSKFYKVVCHSNFPSFYRRFKFTSNHFKKNIKYLYASETKYQCLIFEDKQ